MRSCASRGAKSPGSALNRSSCPRSDRVRRRPVISERSEPPAVRPVASAAWAEPAGPGFEIIDGIDDAPAKFVIGGTSTVGAVFLECPGGQAEKCGRLFRSQVAWRQNGGIRMHGSSLRGFAGRRRETAAICEHGGGERSAGWMGKIGGEESPPHGQSGRVRPFVFAGANLGSRPR